jgi:2-iminobutanoate/2-iminopropanoate deaminase
MLLLPLSLIARVGIASNIPIASAMEQGVAMPRRAVETSNAPSGGSNYSQAVIVGDLVFVAGTPGKDMASDRWPVGIEAQMDQALKNLATVLAEAGCSLDDVVKTTTFIAPEARIDREELLKAEKAYERAFSADPKPARSSPGVDLPGQDALISIEAIAVKRT